MRAACLYQMVTMEEVRSGKTKYVLNKGSIGFSERLSMKCERRAESRIFPICFILSNWHREGSKLINLGVKIKNSLQPSARGLHVAQIAMNAAQHKIVNLFKTLWNFFLWWHITMYLMCGPRQLFFQSVAQVRPNIGHRCKTCKVKQFIYISKLVSSYKLEVPGMRLFLWATP